MESEKQKGKKRGFFFQVCGRSDCCFKEDLDGSFNKGDLDKFTSEEELEQCNNFNVGTFGDNGEYLSKLAFLTITKLAMNLRCFAHLEIVLYHHGTDGGQFEFVDVLAGGGAHFRCPMPDVPIDDDEYQRSRYCKRL